VTAVPATRDPDTHHDHLINLRTGEVIEFQSEEIERRQAEIAGQLGTSWSTMAGGSMRLPLEEKPKR